MRKKKRSKAEVHADRLYILGLVRGGTGKLTIGEITAALNTHRVQQAKRSAAQRGLSEEETEQIVKAARLSKPTVRRDVDYVTRGLGSAVEAGTAVHLDQQIERLEKEIERLHQLDEMIMEDIRRAREPQHSKQVGTPDGKEVKVALVERRTANLAAPAGLYSQLRLNALARLQFHQEIMRLRWGKLWFQRHAEAQNFSQALVEVNSQDPERARAAAELLLEREYKFLEHAQSQAPVPLSGEMLAAERIRLQRSRDRIETLRQRLDRARSLIPGLGAGAQSGGGVTVTIKRIGPGASDGGQ